MLMNLIVFIQKFFEFNPKQSFSQLLYFHRYYFNIDQCRSGPRSGTNSISQLLSSNIEEQAEPSEMKTEEILDVFGANSVSSGHLE